MKTPATARNGLLCFALLALLSGCATVKPYERERLAQRDMQFDRDGNARSGEDHAVSYREGANGAIGSSGGGCGCN
jgi:hypothetical protein